jgi:hypothetical protein
MRLFKFIINKQNYRRLVKVICLRVALFIVKGKQNRQRVNQLVTSCNFNSKNLRVATLGAFSIARL